MPLLPFLPFCGWLTARALLFALALWCVLLLFFFCFGLAG